MLFLFQNLFCNSCCLKCKLERIFFPLFSWIASNVKRGFPRGKNERGGRSERESRQGVSVRICKTFKTDLGLPRFVFDFEKLNHCVLEYLLLFDHCAC